MPFQFAGTRVAYVASHTTGATYGDSETEDDEAVEDGTRTINASIADGTHREALETRAATDRTGLRRGRSPGAQATPWILGSVHPQGHALRHAPFTCRRARGGWAGEDHRQSTSAE